MADETADPAGFEAAMRLYRPRIFRFALASLRDRDAAETVTQDCFLKAHRAWSGFRGEAALQTWLMQIAVNLVRDVARSRRFQFRKRLAFGSVDVGEAADWLPAAGLSPEQQAATRQRVAAVWSVAAGFVYFPNPADKTYSRSPIGNPDTLTWVAAAGSAMSVVSPGTRQAPGDPAALPAQRPMGLPASRPVTETLAPQVVNGIPCNGSRVTIIIPKGALGNDREMKVVNERWYSDELKVLVKSTNSDPRYGLTTYDLTQVVQGPPDPALFQVPAGYRLSPRSR